MVFRKFFSATGYSRMKIACQPFLFFCFATYSRCSMYLIVVFEDDNQTGPMAKEWFSGGLAWWPPYKDQFQILRAVQKRVMPDPAKGWRQFRTRVLDESDSIQTIQSKWDKACITSDLNTDVEMQENPVRERKRPRQLRESSSSLSEEEDDPEHLRRPPPLPLQGSYAVWKKPQLHPVAQ
ncbi:uncharacterized protein LOC132870693 isoform X3 [Neoarius graeffei]|uniref:uncharacterized protein LOC132870693 isoform X3 n=1 Tax=Neoarius graeffei TaxID=443677 RepID=UPI00298BD6C0|nr:uncharacterized protein LOC132870693 isoform X3 [Neoarius graeffei]